MKEIKIFEDELGNRYEIPVEKDTNWFKRAANKVENGFKAVGTFVKEHPVIAFMMLSTAVKGGCEITNTISRAKNAQTKSIDCNARDEKHYDRKNRIWYDLRRPMTNSEKLEFSRRRSEGETDGEILSDMNLI